MLHSAIEEFRASTVEDSFGEVIAVADLHDPNVAAGQCDTVAAAFAAFLGERGIEADVATTDDCSEWGLTWYAGPGGTPDPFHAVTRVGDVLIDWTASQFPGQHEFPRITAV